MIRDTPAPIDPHWQARLAYVQDLIFAAMRDEDPKLTADKVGAALLQLTAVLQDELTARDHPVLLELVRDASRLLRADATDLLGWGSDVRDWQRRAAPFVEGP
jgi:hypothetical protein